MTNSLVGTKIRIGVGEPWNFHAFHDPKDCIGEIVSVLPSESDWVVVKWRFLWDGRIYLYGCLQSRHEGYDNLMERLLLGERVVCNMMFFVEGLEVGLRLLELTSEGLDKLTANKPVFDRTLGLIGGVQLANVNRPAGEL